MYSTDPSPREIAAIIVMALLMVAWVLFLLVKFGTPAEAAGKTVAGYITAKPF